MCHCDIMTTEAQNKDEVELPGMMFLYYASYFYSLKKMKCAVTTQMEIISKNK